MPRKHRTLCCGKVSLELLLALAVGCVPALAAEPPAVQRPNVDVNSGTIKSSLDQQKITVPQQNNVDIEVNREEKPAQEQAQGPKVKVSGFHITGQTIYTPEQLQELIKADVGRELSFSELQAVAQRITDYFNRQGYMVAKAYLPAQSIQDGLVEIVVVPGQYGGIDIRNQSRLSPQTVANLLSSLKTGDYVKKYVLERNLLLLSDIRGVSVKATLAPGADTGKTELIVELHDNDEDATGTFSLDNYGNRYTGQGVGNVTLTINNLSGTGDVFNLGNNYSGNGLNNFSAGYTSLVGTQGARLGVSYSTMHYQLGKEFTLLEDTGKSKTASIFGIYPLVRSRDHNLNAQLQFDYRKITDSSDFGYATSDKHADVWTLGLNGDSQDSSGANTYDVNVSSGRLGFDGGRTLYGSTPQDDDQWISRAYGIPGLRTAGRYTKVNFDFSRWQNLNPRLNFLFESSGQWANKNLDSSEKLYLGGNKGVRAYPQGEASGDQGYLVRGELRWDLPDPALQLALFVDTGHIMVNKNPLPKAGDNGCTLSGAGLGVIASSTKDYTVRLDYAWKLGSHAVTSEHDRRGRWWLYGIQYF
jgi:hemolysin activation/secretion protein